MEAGPALLEKAGDEAVLAQWLDQLEPDLRARRFQRGEGEAFLLGPLAADLLRAEERGKPLERLAY